MSSPIRTHLCLVSEQVLPNLIPALDPALRPEKLILATSERYANNAALLQEALQKEGIAVEQMPIPDPFDFASLRECFHALALAEEGIVANITCGTKPMSVAAHDAFVRADRPVFYINDASLMWFHDAGRPPHNLANTLSLEQFLAVHGTDVTHIIREPLPSLRRKAAYAIFMCLTADGTLASRLNRYAEEESRQLDKEVSAHPPKDLKAVLDILAEHGIARQQLGSKNMPRLADLQAIEFARGGWLEEYVFALLQENRHAMGIQDLARNVKLRKPGEAVNLDNEFDVAVLRGNTLYVIECKTGNYAGNNINPKEIIYQLPQITRASGGLRARGMLLSLHEIKEGMRERARENRLEIIAGKELKEIASRLREFVGA